MTEQNVSERVKLLIAITARGQGRELMDWMGKRGMGYQMQCIGRGTASSEMLDILGIGSSEKDVVISLGKQSAVEQIVWEFSDNMNNVKKGHGMMMLLSPSAVGNLLATILTMKSAPAALGDSTAAEGDYMKNEHRHSLILISVRQGYTDMVMHTARRAGATGGTVVRGRLAAEELEETFKGMSFAEEREILAILAPDSIREHLMNEVNAEFGMRSEAQGVLCAVPVDKAFRI